MIRSSARPAVAMLLMGAAFTGSDAVGDTPAAPGPVSPMSLPILQSSSGLQGLPPYMPTTLADVVEKALPAVVNISSTRMVKTQNAPFQSDPFFQYFFGDPFGRRMPRERRQQSLGSGVIISSDGYVITNNHVVQTGEAQVQVYWENEVYDAEIVGLDPKTDLALLKIEAGRELPHLSFKDSDALRVGDFVLAIGNPFGLDRTVTMGIVSAKGRADVGIVDYEDFIQTDAAINPGNSGGALLTIQGDLIGINTAIMSRSGGYQGIGFAVPSDMAERVVSSLLEHGEVRRGWIGVAVQELTRDLADAMDLNRDVGVLVSSVYEDSPADRSGLRSGDIVLSVDGHDIHNMNQFRSRTERLLPGMEPSVNVLRGDDLIELTLRVEKMPTEEAAVAFETFESSVVPGLSMETLTAEESRRLGYRRRVYGVLITDVQQGTPAFQAGLKPGDIIVEVERLRVRSLEELENVVSRAQGDKLLLVVQRGRRGYYVALPRS